MDKKAVEFTFAKIMGFLLILALLIWAIVYYGGLKDKIASIIKNFIG